MNIVIMGPKGAGKSTVGQRFAERAGLTWLETDRLIEDLDACRRGGERRSCRDIFRAEGEQVFRELEKEAAARAAETDYTIIITGGGLMMDPESRSRLRGNALLVWIDADDAVLWARVTRGGLPPWLEGPDGAARFAAQCAHRREVLRPFADIVLHADDRDPDALAAELEELVSRELSLRQSSPNTWGDIIRVTTFGESHGPAIGAVLDGIRPGVPISEEDIQRELDRRRPGQSKVVTQRRETDTVRILSGIYEGKTTGAPIAMVIFNEDQRSRNYDNLKDLFRPGHGDFTFYAKYGHRDHRAVDASRGGKRPAGLPPARWP
ncbi:MAG TPA: chorismate synthase [Candidatus Hydrogenedentes bacterium]|nr:chorismate synthase [Candidatus Hydrogenedentota bacterium]